MVLPLIPLVSALAPSILGLIDDLFETDEEKANARVKIMSAQGQQKLSEIEQQMSAILAESKSADPWTSRARPSFLYIVYIYILMAIPMGILFWVDPTAAAAVTAGVNGWLAAIPDSIMTLFGVGYLGYTGARSFDKAKINNKK